MIAKKALAVLAFAFAAAAVQAKDSLKLDFFQVRDAISALSQLDGNTKLDRDNNAVRIAYDLSGRTRMAIARDLKTLREAFGVYSDAWKGYLHAQGIVDETKETEIQAKYVNDLLRAAVPLQLERFDESDFVKPDDDKNPVPGTVLEALLPLLKSP
jgi:hypothetical protein